MKKIAIISLFALMAVGCASKGDLAALTTRVDALETAHKAIEADHAALKAEHATIMSDHEAIKAEHSDINARLDRAFTKGHK
jgi:hypothetical protein